MTLHLPPRAWVPIEHPDAPPDFGALPPWRDILPDLPTHLRRDIGLPPWGGLAAIRRK